MEKKLVQVIKQDISRMDKANEYFTQALINLENCRFKETKIVANKCYIISDNIEQRIAIKMILLLAKQQDPELINAFLADIYSYSFRRGEVQ